MGDQDEYSGESEYEEASEAMSELKYGEGTGVEEPDGILRKEKCTEVFSCFVYDPSVSVVSQRTRCRHLLHFCTKVNLRRN